MNYLNFFKRRLSCKNEILGALFFNLLFLLFLFHFNFPKLEYFFYDLWNKTSYFRSNKTNKIVLITIDDQSDLSLGEEYPYSYSVLNKFIDNLLIKSPNIVAFINTNFRFIYDDFELAEKKKFINKILLHQRKGGKIRLGTSIDLWGEKLPPRDMVQIGGSLSLLHKDGLNFPQDQVCRRAIVNISGDETIDSWIAREYLSRKTIKPKGLYYSKDADASFVLFKYVFSPLNTNIRKISFHDVVDGNFSNDFFYDKIVLIGTTYNKKNSDYIFTPFNSNSIDHKLVSKLMVHAEIIESLIQNKTIEKVSDQYTLVFSFIYSLLAIFYILNHNPTRVMIFILASIILIYFLGFALFEIFNIWISIVPILLSMIVLYIIWFPVRAIYEYQEKYKIQHETEILKKVEVLKQNFISLMSHDLKAPLSRVITLTEQLSLKTKDNSLLNGLVNIKDSVHEVDRLITSILDLTKLESNEYIFNKSIKDLNSIVEKNVKKLQTTFLEKKIEVITDFYPIYPVLVDEELVSRILNNLLENVIKYASLGKKVLIKTYDNEDGAFIEIKDYGPGIAENEIENIFEKFYRIKNDRVHEIKGYGLGLYLVKYFVEIQKGKIVCRSELGKGTTFEVFFPYKVT